MSILETNNLSISIANKQVCNDLNLTIEPGQVWGLLGRNGIGKTTLLHTLAGIREADSGTIRLNQENIHTLSRKSVAQKLGLLIQQTEESFPSTVLDTVLTGRHPHIGTWSWESDKDLAIAKKALDTVQLTEMEYRAIDQLSGGERQRVAIASLITQSPNIYLLDEPNSHLDLKYQIQLLQYFSDLAKNNNASVVMSIHDINLAQSFCTHLILLFGEGQFSIGPKDVLLNTDILGNLYQYPLHQIDTEYGQVFIPNQSD